MQTPSANDVVDVTGLHTASWAVTSLPAIKFNLVGIMLSVGRPEGGIVSAGSVSGGVRVLHPTTCPKIRRKVCFLKLACCCGEI